MQSNKIELDHQSLNDNGITIKENINENFLINGIKEFSQSSVINSDMAIFNSNDNYNVVKVNANGNLQTYMRNEYIHDMAIFNSNDKHVVKENMNKINKNLESGDRVYSFHTNSNKKYSHGIYKTQFKLQKNECEQRMYKHNESKSIQGEYAEKILLFYLKSKGKDAKRPEDHSAPFDIIVSNNNSLSYYDEISIEDDHINLIEVKSKITDRENRYDDFKLTGSELKYMLEYNDRYIIYIICFDKSKCPLSLYEYKFESKDICIINKNLESFESTWRIIPRSFDIKFCDKKTKEIKEFRDWLNKDMSEEDRNLFKRIFKRESSASKIIDEIKKSVTGI